MDRPVAALRIGLIALVAFAALALSLHEARFIPSLPIPRLFSRSPDFLEALPEDFPVLEDDVPLASEPVFINGREVISVRLASFLSPASLTAEYARRLKPLGYACVPGGADSGGSGGEFVRFKGEGQAMLGFRDPAGVPMGIVAFENAETGGSDYFITRETDAAPQAEERWDTVEGGDPPGVFLPADAEREYCIEKKGAFPSWLVLYRSWTAPTMVAHLYRSRMPEDGWREPQGASEAFAKSPGGAQLLFHRGADRALVHVAPGDDGEGSWITVAFRRGRR